ncbi:MAG: hypothetical protein HRU40_01095 [Saprospiraceae bacterium]|nr:hypothetical protein [Saprospiraceae bacterium]
MRTCLLVFILSHFLFVAVSQDMELGLVIGGATYEGELSPTEIGDYLKTYRPAVGIFSRYHFTPSLAARGDIRFATIYGDDNISNRTRGFNFRTRLFEASLLGEWTPFRLKLGSGVYLAPYGHVGGGGLYFIPQGERNNEYFNLAPLGTEGQGLPGYPEPYSQLTFVGIGGGGVKIEIDETFTVGLEGGLRYVNSDYLDDVGSTPVSYRDVLDGNGSLAASFSFPNFDLDADNPDATYIRGGEANDFTFMAVFTFSMRISSGKHFNKGGRRSQLGCPTNF